ncbi:hypothetical protein C8J23_1464 [Shewanella chilikensis]|uniref:Transposase n=1 Tax=Shewanella chilikensis TaxID=558541 RepID=A0ABX5PIC4_9GAMM|nr:hypothetical protein C8J23_1464 [Shewanella chilikensis]
MTTARRQLIDAESTPFYHVINRCVEGHFCVVKMHCRGAVTSIDVAG